MGMLLCLPAAQGEFTGFLQHSHAVTQFAGARSEEDARHLLAATSLLQSCTELSKQIPGLTADRPGRINPSKDTSRDGQVRSCHPLCALIDPGSGWCKPGRMDPGAYQITLTAPRFPSGRRRRLTSSAHLSAHVRLMRMLMSW
ncbi:unnamed protein product [Pleuronectes platessa]|uniref:Uncharacterized protein n=1 Tax=Pleuronectes platessa TaxID=8262 RepID=A0A9N7YNJ1_PLEPL|nr:unnamed protein product [Pleuronectes platessa]